MKMFLEPSLQHACDTDNKYIICQGVVSARNKSEISTKALRQAHACVAQTEKSSLAKMENEGRVLEVIKPCEVIVRGEFPCLNLV
jgi:hypothetical protein